MLAATKLCILSQCPAPHVEQVLLHKPPDHFEQIHTKNYPYLKKTTFTVEHLYEQ